MFQKKQRLFKNKARYICCDVSKKKFKKNKKLIMTILLTLVATLIIIINYKQLELII